MEKIDFRKSLKELYSPSPNAFAIVTVRPMMFIKIDGQGDPNSAADYASGVSWLYSVSYAMKFASKKSLQRDYTIPPLEALWWAKDMKAFAEGKKDDWHWTQMIMVPDFIPAEMRDAALEQAGKKLGPAPRTLRFETFDEGLSVQIMHIGSYADEAPTIRRMHEEFLPANGLAPNGLHHELYLSDPRRVASAKLKTIIRQPVRRRQ